jgi:hypothetical protein
MSRTIQRAAFAALITLWLAAAASAQAQVTRVTGTVVNASGAAVPNARLKITKVLKGGVVVSTRPVDVTADSSGAVSFDVLRNSVAYVEGAVVGFEREGGVPVTIPDASTAAFESLVPVANVPTSNLTTHAAVKGSSTQSGHLKCGDGVTCTDGVISVEEGGGVTDHGALTGLSDDDHPQYQLRSEENTANGYLGLDAGALVPDNRLPASIARDSEVAAAVAAHEAAGDPHTQYLNTTRGDLRYYTQAQLYTKAAADALLAAKAEAADLTAEASARAAADTTLQTNISAEASSRASADTTLQANIDAEAAARASAITSASTADRARSNHTGTQSLSTISDAGTAASLNVPASGDAASGEVVKGSDTRLTNSRTPTAHASTHAAAGSDPVTLSQSQVTNLTTDLSNKQASDADLTAIAGLSPSANDVLQFVSGSWANRTTAQLKTSLSLTSSDVGLGSVNNTSDADKPVSTAQQAALDLKQNLLTDSASLRSALSDESGTGAAVFAGGDIGAASATSLDTALLNPTAHLLEQRNGANAQTLRLYREYTSSSNYARLNLTWSSNQSKISTTAQTATAPDLVISAAGKLQFNTAQDSTLAWQMTTSGHFEPVAASNNFDIGASSKPIRSLYVGTSILSPTDGAASIGAAAANRFKIFAYSLSANGATANAGEVLFHLTTNAVRFQSGFTDFGSSQHIRFSGGDPGSVAADIGLKRSAAGILAVTNGSSGYGKISTAASVTWSSGSGSPEGAVTAAVGSLYTRTDGGAGTTLYVKESGAGNTGWVAK